METQNSGCIGSSTSAQIPSVKNNLQVAMTGHVANDRNAIFLLEMCAIRLTKKKKLSRAMALVLKPGASSSIQRSTSSFEAGFTCRSWTTCIMPVSGERSGFAKALMQAGKQSTVRYVPVWVLLSIQPRCNASIAVSFIAHNLYICYFCIRKFTHDFRR